MILKVIEEAQKPITSKKIEAHNFEDGKTIPKAKRGGGDNWGRSRVQLSFTDSGRKKSA